MINEDRWVCHRHVGGSEKEISQLVRPFETRELHKYTLNSMLSLHHSHNIMLKLMIL